MGLYLVIFCCLEFEVTFFLSPLLVPKRVLSIQGIIPFVVKIVWASFSSAWFDAELHLFSGKMAMDFLCLAKFGATCYSIWQ